MTVSSELQLFPPRRDWTAGAACSGMDVGAFFPSGGSYDRKAGRDPTRWVLKPEAAEAKRVCARCPVRDACGTANIGEVDGIWGGTDELERHRARKALQKHVRGLPLAQRQVLGAHIVRKHRLGVAWNEIARQTGLTKVLCQALASAFHAKEREKRANARAAA